MKSHEEPVKGSWGLMGIAWGAIGGAHGSVMGSMVIPGETHGVHGNPMRSP